MSLKANTPRGVSKSRYERMLQEELTRINTKIILDDIQGIRTPHGDRLRQLTYADIVGSRKRPAAYARFRIYRELRRLGFSFPSIARVAGYDHTSILSGIYTINRREPLTTSARPDVAHFGGLECV